MLWNYLRDKTRQAVLAGIHDAVEEIERGDGKPLDQIADGLRDRLALPAPSE
jgi:hypothetical protein